MPRHLLLLPLLVGAIAPVAAQRVTTKVRLADVIGAFLADSGVQTRGLPWSTGDGLAIRWATRGAVANADQAARQRGITHMRQGTFLGTAGDSVALRMGIVVTGTATGIAGVSIFIDSLLVETGGGNGYFVTREMLDQAIRNDGLTLTPLKCSRDTEGASYGNLVDAVKAPGKMAAGLWWFWQSMQQELHVSIGLIYRRVEMEQVECASP